MTRSAYDFNAIDYFKMRRGWGRGGWGWGGRGGGGVGVGGGGGWGEKNAYYEETGKVIRTIHMKSV